MWKLKDCGKTRDGRRCVGYAHHGPCTALEHTDMAVAIDAILGAYCTECHAVGVRHYPRCGKAPRCSGMAYRSDGEIVPCVREKYHEGDCKW